MIYHYNPDEWEVNTGHTTCPFHKENPGVPYAGCTCTGWYSMKRRSLPEPEPPDRETLEWIKRV